MSMLEILDSLENIPYQEASFRLVVEDHLSYLKQTSRIVEVPPAFRERYHGNLYGLLNELVRDSSYQYYWIIMRVNDFAGAMDYERGIGYLRIPDFDIINQLYSRHRTVKKH